MTDLHQHRLQEIALIDQSMASDLLYRDCIQRRPDDREHDRGSNHHQFETAHTPNYAAHLFEDAYLLRSWDESSSMSRCGERENPIENALRTLANEAEITRDGEVVTALLPGVRTIEVRQTGMRRIRFQRTVSCNVTSDENGITLSNIRGVQIDPGPLTPWINASRIQIDRDRVRATVGRFGVQTHISFDLQSGQFDQIRRSLRQAGILPR